MIHEICSLVLLISVALLEAESRMQFMKVFAPSDPRVNELLRGSAALSKEKKKASTRVRFAEDNDCLHHVFKMIDDCARRRGC
jgi:hypothetical protein